MSARTAAALLLAALAVSAGASGPAPSAEGAPGHDWAGHVVPPYPSGWRVESAGCIGTHDDAGGPCVRAIEVIRDGQSGLRMILGLEQVKSFGKEPLWRIVDVLEPDALSDAGVFVAHGTCQRRAADDGAIAAIVEPGKREWLPAREAWRLDVGAGRFVPVPPGEVRCRNEGFGYDG